MSAAPPSRSAARRARAEVSAIVEHHFGTPPRRVVRRGGGLTNLVFAVDHPEGELVVRMNPAPDKIGEFIKEQWAVARARESGIPVPEVLEVGNGVGTHPYMISRHVRGEPALRHPERERILREMGRLTARINGIPTDGWGATFDWSHNRLSRNDSWEACLQRELCVDDRLAVLARLGGLDDDRLARLREALEGLSDAGPTLAHGDMRMKNVIVDARGGIVAVIDWDECRSAPAPAWDLAIALHDLSIDDKRAFVEGYGLDADALERLAGPMRALNLLHYAPWLERAEAAGDRDELAHLRARLRGAFELYGV
ncbi:MAG TPA: aminoglycoside phosphotransferase family protein [Burkholderiaceae bacterium]|nr:aminoglycoside phosphotransferase family protein [Burkholderiaceae bacterium]